ncbi:hypothetical protein H5J22_02600 [Cetobacterium sp. 8H]|uniref:hypothetical protein n=1 Tax=Cetobacterium sp. 8H TaxID=2759681 RepID=UPI00163D0011|nr:hypothetical protein [Cetobacterium sp. 8H]MBC2850333.1 hypothetical protein [Cetobacterium sp. 8H]
MKGNNRPLIKKEVWELNEQLVEEFLENIGHDFALDSKDIGAISNHISSQLITVIKDTAKLKSKSELTVLGIDTSKDFTEKILLNLPPYMRKTKLIIELAKTISTELQRLDLLKQEKISSLLISTNSINLNRLEQIYGSKLSNSLGIRTRQNILIAKEITKYERFNKDFIYKVSQYFQVGEILDIINDKDNKSITIVLEENKENIKTFNLFQGFVRTVSPAFYEINIIN